MQIGVVGRRVAAISMLVFPLVAAAQANDPRAVQPERPTVATHAHTVAAGFLEIETGVQRDRITGTQLWSAPTVFKLGLASHLQLNVGVPAFFGGGDSLPTGAGDVTLGLKWRFLDDNRVLGDFAVLPSVKLPTASTRNDLGTGLWDASLNVISSHEVRGTSIDLNAIYARIGIGDPSAYSWSLFTASFGFPVVGRLGWVAELYGSPAVTRIGLPANTSFLTGPTFSIFPELALDFGLITPLRDGFPHSVYAGLVWNAGPILPLAGSSSLARVPAR
jgi:hypothetical protein